MEWKNIRDLLATTLSRVGSRAELERETLSIICEQIKINLPQDAIRVKNGVALISAHPAIKNEISLRKKSLLASLEARGLGKRVTDIR